MGERRASVVIEEWRELERALAGRGVHEIERTRLRWRISELRAEYQLLSQAAAALLAGDAAPAPPGADADAEASLGQLPGRERGGAVAPGAGTA